MEHSETIVGIDLGTTYSEVAAFLDGKVTVLGTGGMTMLPSCVGLSASGDLLVGEAARNQHLLYPERTVVNVKRSMGLDDKFTLGGARYTPQEISALILRELRSWAERALGRPITKAVITVPAYFSDAQRHATREAGALADLEVLRILNEPTAAGLAFGYGDGTPRTVLIYDLGGGTFDVSIVSIEGDVTEVLASHGNNRLGGNDFTALLLDRLLEEFKEEYGVDLRDAHPSAHSRLWWACEETKRTLSAEPYAVIREEALIESSSGIPLHVEREISRDEYEELIGPTVETTLDSVATAMKDAGKTGSDLDAVLLVGGSTRTPLVAQVLEERIGIAPRRDMHPDLCVALGAGVLASRLSGLEVDQVLVDVSPYSFGPSYIGEMNGTVYRHCYHPIIYRNTPLPVTRTDRYHTAHPYQDTVDIEIYQGDDPDALKNVFVGNFRISGLTPMEEPNEVLCRMSLDLDGILQVTAIEKLTGKSKRVTIRNALKTMTADDVKAARRRLEALFASRAADTVPLTGEDLEETVPVNAAVVAAPVEDEDKAGSPPPSGEWDRVEREARALVDRCRQLFSEMHDDDKEEAIGLHEEIERAIASRDTKTVSDRVRLLKELLFFVEGK